MRNILLLALSIALAFQFSCKNTAIKGVSGTIENAKNMKVYLEKVDLFQNSNLNIENGETDAKGSFALPYQEGMDSGLYRIRAGRKSAYLLIDDFDNPIEIKGDLNSLDKYEYKVAGSAATNKLLSYIRESQNATSMDKLSKELEAEPDAKVAMYASLFALTNPQFYSTHKAIASKLVAENQNNKDYQTYFSFSRQLEAQYQESVASQAVQVGSPAPDINLKNPDGKPMKLSDLKGNIVLLDFWASWCGPCRRANPHVVDVYNRYKDKGFTVYSVSLDGLDNRTRQRFKGDQLDRQLKRQKDRWLKAIDQDKLAWDYHVSDLMKWDSEGSRMYGVRSIPQTFLINRDGTIAAVNPRNTLEQELQKLL